MKINNLPIYKGDAKPVNLYQGAHKVAGWVEQEQTGLDLAFEDTYNDRVGMAALGRSKQAQTVQGKNLCPTDFSEWEMGMYDLSTGEEVSSTSWLRLNRLIQVEPSTYYYLSTNQENLEYSFVVRGYDQNKVFVRSHGLISFPTVTVIGSYPDEYYYGVMLYKNGSPSSMAYELWQGLFEDGTMKPFICLNSESDKSFEEYIPDSPSPDYPSPIISSAGEVRAQDQAGAQYADIVIPELRGIPDGAGGWAARDELYVERVGGEWHLMRRQRVGQHRILPRHWNDWDATTKRVLDPVPDRKVGLGTLGLCNCARAGAFGVPNSISVYVSNIYTYWYPDYKAMGLSGSEAKTDADAVLRNWLAANEVWHDYILATPITTDLGPIDLPSYYPYTRILVSGDYPPDVTATCKVIDRGDA